MDGQNGDQTSQKEALSGSDEKKDENQLEENAAAEQLEGGQSESQKSIYEGGDSEDEGVANGNAGNGTNGVQPGHPSGSPQQAYNSGVTGQNFPRPMGQNMMGQNGQSVPYAPNMMG